jgi:hypothetical protein
MAPLRLRSLSLGLLFLTCVSAGAAASPRVYPPNCTIPSFVRVVGTSNGVPDRAAGEFLIVIRDIVNTPTSGALVVIDLSGTPDVVLCSDQLDANEVMNCATHTVAKSTDALGEARFTLLGSSTGTNDVPSPGWPARIYANGVLVRDLSVSAFDLDGSQGVGGGDLSVWLTDFGSGAPHPRSDYDGSGDVSAGDLSEWLTEFGASASSESCHAACP